MVSKIVQGSWKNSHPSRLIIWAGTVLIVFILILPFSGSTFDNAIYDALFTLRGPQDGHTDMVIIGIDDDSFQELQMQWPWPRSVHASLLDTLHKERARGVVFDILFDTKSKNNNDDLLFGQAIKKQPNVILAASQIINQQDSYTKISWFDPVSALLAGNTLIGGIDLPVDSDGHVRRVHLEYDGRASLGLLAAQLFAGKVHPLHVPVQDQHVLINYLGPRQSIPTVSYYQALQPKEFLPPHTFKDKLVFIGSTSELSSTPNMPDHFLTPFSRRGSAMPGVEIHATIAHNVLRQNFISTPTWPVQAMGGGVAILLGLAFFYCSPSKGFILFSIVSALSLLSSYLAYTQALTSIALSSLLIPLVFLFIVSTCTHYYELYRTERRNRELLAKSEKRIRELLANQEITESSGRVRVFISYKHKAEDAGYMAEILEFLTGLQREGIDFWTDLNLAVGERWDQTIKQELSSSNIALVLISQAYLDSDYCINIEINSFLDRKVIIMPIILSPCEVEQHSWLQERQYLPSGGETISEHFQDQGKRQRMFLEIRNELRKQAKKILSSEA